MEPQHAWHKEAFKSGSCIPQCAQKFCAKIPVAVETRCDAHGSYRAVEQGRKRNLARPVCRIEPKPARMLIQPFRHEVLVKARQFFYTDNRCRTVTAWIGIPQKTGRKRDTFIAPQNCGEKMPLRYIAFIRTACGLRHLAKERYGLGHFKRGPRAGEFLFLHASRTENK